MKMITELAASIGVQGLDWQVAVFFSPLEQWIPNFCAKEEMRLMVREACQGLFWHLTFVFVLQTCMPLLNCDSDKACSSF